MVDVVFVTLIAGVIVTLLILLGLSWRRQHTLAAKLYNYEQLIQHIPGVVYILGMRPDDQIFLEYVSSTNSQINQLRQQDIIENLYAGIPPEYIARHQQRMQHSRDTMEPFSDEIPKEINGQTRWLQYKSTPKRRPDGTVVWYGIEFDVTAQKQAERRFKLLSDLTFEGIIIHENGIAKDMNRAFLDLFGYTHDEVVNKDAVTMLFTPPSQELIWRNVQEHYTQPYEVEAVRKDGSTFPAEVEARQITPRVRVAAIRDVTKRQEAERQQLALKLANERARLLTEFIEHTAHEFRTSLASIMTNSYMVRRKADPDKHLKRIEDAVSEITLLLNEMIEMMRLDQEGAFQTNKINIQEVMNASIIALRDEAAKKTLKITTNHRDVPLHITGDADKLLTAISHVLHNAIIFTPENGEITVTTLSRDDQAVIRITDTGIGMDATVQERIFERFYRADEARTLRGAGLGLSITQKVIEGHDGEIHVHSEPGVGSTFELVLPLAAENAPS